MVLCREQAEQRHAETHMEFNESEVLQCGAD